MGRVIVAGIAASGILPDPFGKRNDESLLQKTELSVANNCMS
jgi:hypothetical protein